MLTGTEDAASFAAIAIGRTRPRMSCLVQESRESKTLSSLLRAMLTHSGLCVLRVRSLPRYFRAWLRRLDNYRRWWRFNCRFGDFIPALCIDSEAHLQRAAVVSNKTVSELCSTAVFRRLSTRWRTGACSSSMRCGGPPS
jgi:hypothetical protein